MQNYPERNEKSIFFLFPQIFYRPSYFICKRGRARWSESYLRGLWRGGTIAQRLAQLLGVEFLYTLYYMVRFTYIFITQIKSIVSLFKWKKNNIYDFSLQPLKNMHTNVNFYYSYEFINMLGDKYFEYKCLQIKIITVKKYFFYPCCLLNI